MFLLKADLIKKKKQCSGVLQNGSTSPPVLETEGDFSTIFIELLEANLTKVCVPLEFLTLKFSTLVLQQLLNIIHSLRMYTHSGRGFCWASASGSHNSLHLLSAFPICGQRFAL
jgi:hypothetical protein